MNPFGEGNNYRAFVISSILFLAIGLITISSIFYFSIIPHNKYMSESSSDEGLYGFDM